MKRNILVPFDGSDSASEALHLAIAFAKTLQEKIVVLHVQPKILTTHVKQFLNEKFDEEIIRSYKEDLFEKTVASAKTILDGSGVEYEIKRRTGDAKEQIIDEAKGMCMIVMGSRGMNPILGGVMGSVSYGVLNSTPCPVTIVPFSCISAK